MIVVAVLTHPPSFAPNLPIPIPGVPNVLLTTLRTSNLTVPIDIKLLLLTILQTLSSMDLKTVLTKDLTARLMLNLTASLILMAEMEWMIYLTHLYLLVEEVGGPGPFGQMEALQTLFRKIKVTPFVIILVKSLRDTWANFIFAFFL